MRNKKTEKNEWDFFERKMSGTGTITFTKYFVAPQPQTLTYCPEGYTVLSRYIFKCLGPMEKE